MIHKLRWLALAGLMALLAASGAACGGDDEEEPKAAATLCDNVVCDGSPNVQCDPADGVCKCGGPAGPICQSDQACVLEPTPSCVSGACALITCERGMTCDPTRGECTCGGDVCDEGTLCIDNRCVTGGACDGVACGGGEQCDPADGQCKCGDSTCSFGERCEEGACVADPCAGVNCGEGSFCSPTDGLCHCGNVAGPVCTTGQTCVGGSEAPACEGTDVCANAATRCPTGTVCDPTSPTGVCRCGGLGETNPVCASDQTCDPDRKQCLGGNQCEDVVCTDGLSCNPENGKCTCGGVGGAACAEGELCVSIDESAACTTACNPFDSDSCGDGNGCFFDASQPNVGTFCAPLHSSPAAPDGECFNAIDCQAGYHCAVIGGENKCRPYCHDATPSELPCVGQGQTCNPISGAPEGSGLGVCGTLN